MSRTKDINIYKRMGIMGKEVRKGNRISGLIRAQGTRGTAQLAKPICPLTQRDSAQLSPAHGQHRHLGAQPCWLCRDQERPQQVPRAASCVISVLLNYAGLREPFTTRDIWRTNSFVLPLQSWGLAAGFNENHRNVGIRLGGQNILTHRR